MMIIRADLHIHSKYARATSKYSDLEHFTNAMDEKGIELLATGDFTHPNWIKELKEKTEERDGLLIFDNHYFILSVEVNNVFENHRIHNVILCNSIETAYQINDYLSKYGNLKEDGRPTIHLKPSEMLENLKQISKKVEIFPAHIWTPWFSLFGSKSGVNKIEEAFEDKSNEILALETGLSSDPNMNYLFSDSSKYTLISNSDAHSPKNIGREANVLDIPTISYDNVIHAIKTRSGFVKTYEFFPQEGKYYFDGHRKCNVRFSPEQAILHNNICPVCKKKLTLGVLHRIYELKDEPKIEEKQVFSYIIPLRKLIAKMLNKREENKHVEETYYRVINYFGSELNVFESELNKIKQFIPELYPYIASIKKNEIIWKEGYDGVYGDFSLKQQTILDY